MNEYAIVGAFLTMFCGLVYFIYQTKKLSRENFVLQITVIELKRQLEEMTRN
jgi:hypothetical protein